MIFSSFAAKKRPGLHRRSTQLWHPTGTDRRRQTDAPRMLPAAKPDVRGGRADVVPPATALRVAVREAARGERGRVAEERLVAVRGRHGARHEGVRGHPRAVRKHDVLQGVPYDGHWRRVVSAFRSEDMHMERAGNLKGRGDSRQPGLFSL